MTSSVLAMTTLPRCAMTLRAERTFQLRPPCSANGSTLDAQPHFQCSHRELQLPGQCAPCSITNGSYAHTNHPSSVFLASNFPLHQHTQTHVQTHTHAHTNTHTRTHTRTHTHTHTHTHKHTITYSLLLWCGATHIICIVLWCNMTTLQQFLLSLLSGATLHFSELHMVVVFLW